ncbi:hypothetical protein ASE40_01510 [Flavobacterium sp. Root935]|jgi:hypothetical protein|nr:hypothetical protein ASE40_01510 [Flavobacterium sp. Root935]MDQ1167676.1 hypothetical protein [Flavobacterium sp. SORGH_AS_0622]TDX09032.1 hypothetical protein EDB96_3949 [Flavobacterium sp. S87F.05.LMB.W.Kidney.N]
MITKKFTIVLLLVFIIIFIGIDLSPILKKENVNDISFSDFRNSIGPFLTFIAVFITYKKLLRNEKNEEKQSTSSF